MKNILKHIGIWLTAAGLIGCMRLFAACGETDDGEESKIAYSVTVLDPAGEPLEGIEVKWGNVKTVYKTLDSGKATANLPKADYTVALEKLSPIYRYTPVTVTPSEPEKTVALAWNPEEGKLVYTVKVLLPDGKPLKGVEVELCVLADEGGACQPFPAATNANGEAYSIGVIDEEFEAYLRGLEPEEYTAKILSGLPAEYTYAQDANGYYTGGKATPGNPVLTIQLEPAE